MANEFAVGELLRRIDGEFSGEAPLHLVMDNAVQGTPDVKDGSTEIPAARGNKGTCRDSFLSVDDRSRTSTNFLPPDSGADSAWGH